jgi:MFS transporter, FSR family, fosmidomycin resistance protein
VGGTRAAAWPLIRNDLTLTYVEVGCLLAIPGFVGSALDPLIGVAGDTRRRRTLMFVGGLAFAVSAALTSIAIGFWTLLAALVLGNPATGAFVSLAQATLMDREPDKRERNMARWTLAGSFGYVGGPLLLAGALWLGLGWRGVIAALAVVSLPLAVAARRIAPAKAVGALSLRESVCGALTCLRSAAVLRGLAVLEAANLLLDVFHGYLALYLVDVAHFDVCAAALGVATWTGAGLAGDFLLLLVLQRVDGGRYLRATAVAMLVAYPTFLIVPHYGTKLALIALLGLLNSGWYALPKAALYASLPGRSGTVVAVGGIGGLLGASVPLLLGFVAAYAGLASTMWLLLLAPLAILSLVPRASQPHRQSA